MRASGIFYEVIGHALVTIAFLVVVLYVLQRRRKLRRTTRKAFLLYWLIMGVGVLSAFFNVMRLVYVLTMPGRLSAFLDVTSEYLSMIGQSVVIVMLIGLRVLTERVEMRQRRILAIGAHPDDVEIACGAAMARFHDAGAEIYGYVMTHGEQGGDASVRPAEARRGAEFLGLDHVTVYNFPDTLLQQHSVEITRTIEEQIKKWNPDMIFTHSGHDLHQDHRTVHEATLRAARNHKTIFCYESPSVTQDFTPTFFIDVGDYIDVKVESIKEHWDQHGKPYVQPERVKGVAVFRGGQGKLKYAEAFEVVRACLSTLG